MGKTVTSATDASANWSAAMQDQKTASKYSKGIDRVTTSPMAAAADALPLYLARVTDAVNSGRMERSLRGTDFNYWKSQAKGVGAGALSKGAIKGKPKVDRANAKLQTFWQAASDAANNLPKGDFEAGKARWEASARVMAGAKGATK